MGPSDFALSVLASWLGNKIEFLLNNKESSDNKTDIKIDHPGRENKNKVGKFRTFDVWLELDDILLEIEEPVGHLIIETSPTTFYYLTTLVLESRKTGEWYVFRRGRMSFQSTGGGKHQIEILLNKFINRKVAIALWSVEKETLDQFESGELLWHELKQKLIPLRSSVVDQRNWDYFKERAQGIIEEFYKR
jgi:hypothetical protein